MKATVFRVTDEMLFWIDKQAKEEYLTRSQFLRKVFSLHIKREIKTSPINSDFF